MSGSYLLAPTFLVIIISLLVVRAGAILLRFTGMDEQSARFQALSAFTRTGFTTREAEEVMANPRRRQIITWLIILGNAGLVTVIVTATSSLTSSSGFFLGINVVILLVGLFVIYFIARHTPISRVWGRFIEKRISVFNHIHEASSEELLHHSEGYSLRRISIEEGSSFTGKSLPGINTAESEFWVVGIERGKNWLTVPVAQEKVQVGDTLVVYGKPANLRKVFARPSSDRKDASPSTD